MVLFVVLIDSLIEVKGNILATSLIKESMSQFFLTNISISVLNRFGTSIKASS